MKKFLLSLLCLAGFTAAQADEVAFVADGATYSGTAATVTIANNASGNIAGETFANDYISVTHTKVNNSDSKVSSNAVRLYKNDILTITPAENYQITQIVFTTTGGDYQAKNSTCNLTADAGTFSFDTSDKTITWTGSTAEALAITASGNQTRFTTMVVTYIAEGQKVVAAPTITPNGGEITTETEISITAEEGTIYYTTNGDDPTTESTEYTAPFTLTENATVKAIAVVDGTASSVASASFVIPVSFGYVKTVESGKKYVLFNDDRIATGSLYSGSYGSMNTTTITEAEGYIKTNIDNAITITAVEGGYTLQNSDGKYLYQKGTYNNFNVTTDASTEGTIWTIEPQDDGTMKITNVAVQKYIQYDASSYNSYYSYAEETGLMPYLYEEGATAEEKPDVTIETATSIANFYEITNKVIGAKAVIGFDLTVIAVAGKNVYVYDGTDYSCVYGTNSLAATDVIAKGWEATYGEYQGLWEICPVGELTTTGTAGTLPDPMEIAGEEIAVDLQSAYVKIVNVNVEPLESGSFTGSDENETEISFYNKFGTAVPTEGKAMYDVIGIVSYYESSSTPLQIYPLEYVYKGEYSAIENVEVENDEAVECYNLQGVKVANPENGLFIRKQGNKATKVLVK